MKESKSRRLSDVMLKNDFKFGVTIFLLTLAFVQYSKSPDFVRTLCLYGVAFSTLGDLFLMDYMGTPSYIFKGKQFYAGAASFIVTHMLYRQMFRAVAPEADLLKIGYVTKFILAIVFLIVLCKIKPQNKSATFFLVAGFYTGTILSNLAAAINCAVYLKGQYIFAAIGVVCFIISDMLLFVRETSLDTPLIRKLIWVFYPLAQILIIVNM